jgi:bifunctional non-homologous end joining protein LigD
LPGSAEQIPLDDESVDGVFAAQAFHWFDKPVALPEIARVLRAHGIFAIVWNQGDDDRPDPRPSEFVHEVQLLHDAALRRWENEPDWEDLLHGSRLFDDVHDRTSVAHDHVLDRAGILDNLRSVSWIASRDDGEDVIARLGAVRVSLSSADRVLFPDDGITKGDLFAYYEAVTEAIVPHLRDRPFTMKRWREGLDGEAFFQKQAPKGIPDWIPTREFRTWPRGGKGESRLVDFPLVNSTDALLWMVQMHCIDMNAWYSRVDRPERPDWVLFDLDPPEQPDAFQMCVRVAHYLQGALEELDLESFVKTSGADGIHILVPIARRSSYEETYEFAELLSRKLEAEHPGEVTTEWLKRKRAGVLVDHRQNGHGKTIASVYSVRPKPGAPVSTPLRWEELTESVRPRDFSMQVALDRVAKHGDLFEPVLHGKQALGRALQALR